jgi:hypothetical protein
MTNYQLGKIYKIVCNTTGLTYYGSTCEPTLARRLSGHVGKCKRFKEGKTQRYITSFEILEGKNYVIILVELFPCDSKMKLHQRERFYIEGNDCVNQVIPTRTRDEANLVNRDQINEYLAEYRLNNKDIIKVRQAEFYQKNKEEIDKKNSEWYLNNKDRAKISRAEYYLKNKDIIKKNGAERYLKNKAKKIAESNV